MLQEYYTVIITISYFAVFDVSLRH